MDECADSSDCATRDHQTGKYPKGGNHAPENAKICPLLQQISHHLSKMKAWNFLQRKTVLYKIYWITYNYKGTDIKLHMMSSDKV